RRRTTARLPERMRQRARAAGTAERRVGSDRVERGVRLPLRRRSGRRRHARRCQRSARRDACRGPLSPRARAHPDWRGAARGAREGAGSPRWLSFVLYGNRGKPLLRSGTVAPLPRAAAPPPALPAPAPAPVAPVATPAAPVRAPAPVAEAAPRLRVGRIAAL